MIIILKTTTDSTTAMVAERVMDGHGGGNDGHDDGDDHGHDDGDGDGDDGGDGPCD